MTSLQVAGLTKRYGDRLAVQDISFSISQGEIVAFLGPNGAGKSTALRMMAGFFEPDSGDAQIMGASIRSARRKAQASLGYLPEGAPLYLDLSVRAFLEMIAAIHGMTGAALRNNLDKVVEAAMLGSVLRAPIASLSKGFRRRVALAAAMIHDPPVLLLDEPTDGLDPIQKTAMRGWITRMRADKAVLISTHQLEEVEAMCTRAIVISAGVIVADDKPGLLAARGPSARLDEAFRVLTQHGEVA